MSIDPVRKSVVVRTSQERAFAVFTTGIDSWWPRQHHTGTSPMKTAVLEPRMGGRWYTRNQDGSESETGKVLQWDPPRRLVLAWQLTAQWRYDATFVTEVEVTFTAQGLHETLVVLEHRNLDRFGADAAALIKQIDDPQGWELLLNAFAGVAHRDAVVP